jgi:hypothetical protein
MYRRPMTAALCCGSRFCCSRTCCSRGCCSRGCCSRICFFRVAAPLEAAFRCYCYVAAAPAGCCFRGFCSRGCCFAPVAAAPLEQFPWRLILCFCSRDYCSRGYCSRGYCSRGYCSLGSIFVLIFKFQFLLTVQLDGF